MKDENSTGNQDKFAKIWPMGSLTKEQAGYVKTEFTGPNQRAFMNCVHTVITGSEEGAGGTQTELLRHGARTGDFSPAYSYQKKMGNS